MVMLAKGYAILDGPTMPIIAEGDAEPNDTFVEQLKGADSLCLWSVHLYFLSMPILVS